MAAITNVLIDMFPGLSLPSTLCLPLPSSTTTDQLLSHIASLLPTGLAASTRFLITTTSNKPILFHSAVTTTLLDLTETSQCRTHPPLLSRPSTVSFLPLRLSVAIPGGKGGFGSQLRAAGGRMASRKKRTTDAAANGSYRNLDGRRLRTITEAKHLATYLATKPEMDRREKEERRKRWEAVVEMAERREEEMRSGKSSDGKRKGLSEDWIVEKEEVGEGVRSAVAQAMAGLGAKERADESSGSSRSRDVSEEDSEDDDNDDKMELDDYDMSRLKAEADMGDEDAIWVLKNRIRVAALPPPKKQERRYAGFDEEEFLSSDDDDNDNDNDGDRARLTESEDKDKNKGEEREKEEKNIARASPPQSPVEHHTN